MTNHEFKSKSILTKEEAETYRLPWEHQLANISPKAKTDDNNNDSNSNDNKNNGNPRKSLSKRGGPPSCLCCVLICCTRPADGQSISTKTLVTNQEEDSMKPTKGQIELWSSDFKHLINDENGRKLFEVFLREEYCEENLEFWLEVENFRKLEGDLMTKANGIYLMFVKPMSEREVNISGATRKKIAEDIEKDELSHDVFDSAQSQVQYLMHRQSYPRFLTSTHLNGTM